MRHLFLSPHFDDAALSCGGTIYKQTRNGHVVTIATTMAGSPFDHGRAMPDSPIIRELHSRWAVKADVVEIRREEDRRAAARLGADYTHDWSWTDCIYRTINGTGEACYPTEEAVFGDIHPLDAAVSMSSPSAHWVFDGPTTIYAPLGVGHHVDHQLVRNLGLEMMKRPWTPAPESEKPLLALMFYEEYPYTKVESATQHALDIFGAITPDLRLEPEVVELSEADMQAKIEAIACYKTQISTFWRDLKTMEQDVREMLMRAGDGVPAERYWRVVAEE